MQKLAMAASSAALIALAGPLLAEPQAEVLHWWTAGGEAKAVGVLQEEFAEQGGTWTDMPVAGGGGDQSQVCATWACWHANKLSMCQSSRR